MKERYFSQKIEEVDHKILDKNKGLKRLGACRVISFGLCIFGFAWAVREGSIFGWLLGIVMLGGFG